MKRNKRKLKIKNKIKRSNPFAKAVRTPLFKSRVEKDRKKEAKKTGKYLEEE
jgi:stalled ribosome alternative rescue factor ArfA